MSLFADDQDLSGCRYGAIVTNLALPGVEVWRLYRGRADCDQPVGRRTAAGWSREAGCVKAAQNRIKGLKYDFALGTLSRQNFWATEAAMHWVMLAFNLMSLFRTAMQRRERVSGL